MKKELDPIRAPTSARFTASLVVGVFVVLGLFVGASWWVGGPYWKLAVTALISGGIGAAIAGVYLKRRKA